MELDREVREVNRSGLASLRGDREEKRDYTSGDTFWGVSGGSSILGTPVQGCNTEKWSPLTWFEKQENYQEGCKKARLLMKIMHILACSQSEIEEADFPWLP